MVILAPIATGRREFEVGERARGRLELIVELRPAWAIAIRALFAVVTPCVRSALDACRSVSNRLSHSQFGSGTLIC
jgi:hypothetical protein